MNVSPTNATPAASAKSDPLAAATTTRVVLGPDSGSIELPVETDATQGDTFSQMLSRGMTGFDDVLQGKPGKPPAAPVEPGVPLVGDAVPDGSGTRIDPTARSRGPDVALTEPLDAVGVPRPTPKAGDATKEAVPDDERGRHDDAAANDLAAQLALVSQWAGIAKTPVPQGAQGGDGLDIQDKLATVRGTATSPMPRSAPSQRGGRVAVEPQDAPSLRLAPATAKAFAPEPRDADRGSAKTDPVTARTPVELIGAAAGTARTPTDSIVAPTGAFAQQIAAAIAPPAGAGTSIVPTVDIHEQVGTPAWSSEVGQATLRIATTDLQSASLQINPEHLGPVDVQVRIDNGVAHLSFNAAHADTRQAIESSRPTLDRLFADQGLKIGDCAVGDSSTPRRNAEADAALAGQSQRNGSGRWDQAAGRNTPGDAAATTITTRLKALGLVDTFA